LEGQVDVPRPSTGGDPSPIELSAFYGPVAFHGSMLQGLTRVDAIGADFARGSVATGNPATWIPDSQRRAWVIDPLALDSALQLSGLAAWVREGRAGTPIGIRRLAVLSAMPAGDVAAEVRFASRAAGSGAGADRWGGTLYLRDARGKMLLVAEDTAVELRRSAAAPALVLKPEWTNPALWPAVQDLKIRLEMAQAVGMRNPYFAVHDGTARNTTVVAGRELVNFSSYNYVGLSGDPRVVAATCAAVERYGTSVSASRVASGERAFHRDLERELAAAQGAEDALVFTAGHATNVTTIGHLFGKGDLILHDELIHDSALQGIKLSGAARRSFRHDDPAHLEQLLVELRGHHEKCLVVIEGVYSMDGDIPDLPAVLALKKKYGCLLMVDEAHSFGVIGATGRGIAEHFGIDGREIDLWMGTLSKSLASCGGWIAGAEPVITYLRYTAPGFVYSAGLTAANGVAALTALRLLLEEPWRVHRLQANARIFWQALRDRGVDTGPALGGSGVVPAVTGNSLWALQLSGRLLDLGVNVQPIVYPAVADDAARLRFFLSSTHTEEQLTSSAAKVADALAAVKAEFPMP
nr:aminotransferase class I/II-fold pyridoxal phosphate-dependent enzyme [Deltaproteobacteria bacterium]